MKDVYGEIIYIGKSINLKRRVGSYFLQSKLHSVKIAKMCRQVDEFDVFYTDTELDALILECRWIKQYKPRYNTLLTKDHHYFYLDFYQKPTYRLELCRASNSKATIRLGPFTNNRLAMKGIHYIKKNYPFLFCDFRYKQHLSNCHSYQLNRCEGVCSTLDNYSLEYWASYLIKENNFLIENVTKSMMQASEGLEFERASELLEAVHGLKYLNIISKRLLKALEEDYFIGIIPLANGRELKFYVIYQGHIILSEKAYLGEYKKVITRLKRKTKSLKPVKRMQITLDEVDELLIIQSYIKKMSLVAKV